MSSKKKEKQNSKELILEALRSCKTKHRYCFLTKLSEQTGLKREEIYNTLYELKQQDIVENNGVMGFQRWRIKQDGR